MKTDNAFLLDDVDKDKITDLLKQNDENTKYFNEVVDSIVNSYCKGLDDLMNRIQTSISDSSYPITDEELESACLKLPNMLYFVGEAAEAVGVKNDIAKAVKLEAYNKAHLDASGTVADKDAKASTASQYEQIIENMYNRASKKIRQRCDAGYEMLSAVKKVINRRMQAYDLANVDSARIGGTTRSINRLDD